MLTTAQCWVPVLLAKALSSRSTFASSEASVAIMVAGVELQQKLLQRLRMLPGEAPQTDVNEKPSPLKSSPDEGRLEELFGEEARLRQQVLEARKQRDAARTRRRQIEKESLGHHSNTAKDIARYHCQLQSLQNDITMNKQEFNVLRQQCRNKESQQLQARKLQEEAALCKAQKAQVAAEVETETKRVAALRAEVKTWEQRLKEVLARKVVAEAQAMERRLLKASGENDETVPKFTMNTDSDHGEEDEEEEEGNIMDDLELSYEGLELSSLMPLPSAVRLAAGHISDHEALSKVDIPETGFLERGGVEFGRWTRPSPSGNAEWTEEELEAEYGEHLRNLEKVLLELRQEQAEQAEERRCQSRLAALKQKKKEEAAAAAAAARNRFPWSLGMWMRQEKAEAPTPKVSVVSGFRAFSPYAAVCRKYTALAV